MSVLAGFSGHGLNGITTFLTYNLKLQSVKKFTANMKKSTSLNKSRLQILQSLFNNYGFLFLLIIYSLFFLITLPYGSFNDEDEQFTAGWFISQGLIPYQDFFSHHGPLPLFLGSIPFLLFGYSILNFLILRFFILIFHLICWSITWRFSHKKYRFFVGMTMVLIGVLLPVFNLHMTLATSIVTITLWLLTFLTFQHIEIEKPKLKTLIVCFAVGAFICIWSSIASLIPLAFLSFLLIIHWSKKKYWAEVFQQKKLIVVGIFLHRFLFGGGSACRRLGVLAREDP